MRLGIIPEDRTGVFGVRTHQSTQRNTHNVETDNRLAGRSRVEELKKLLNQKAGDTIYPIYHQGFHLYLNSNKTIYLKHHL